MHPRLAPQAPSSAAQMVIGETGCSALVIVLLATGAGLLLDFQVTNLHPVFSVALPLVGVPAALYWAARRTTRSMGQNRQSDYVRNLALAAVAGQAGCLSVVLIFLALFAGLFLDARLDTHPVFTIGLVLVSVPISLYAMVRLMLSSVGAIKLTPPPGKAASAQADPVKDAAEKENGS